jgi:hypothetical protein
MAQAPLNPEGGTATIIGSRLTNADNERVIELAARQGVTKSEMFRLLIREGLAQLDPEEPVPP